MCVPACAHMSTFDTLQMAPLSISANRSMSTDGSLGQWTIPVWSGTETSIQFLLMALKRGSVETLLGQVSRFNVFNGSSNQLSCQHDDVFYPGGFAQQQIAVLV